MQFKPHKAFTLIEFLVVTSIIGLLIAILLPVLGSALISAEQLEEIAASRSLTQAYLGHSIDRKGVLLVGYTDQDTNYTDPLGNPIGGEAIYRWPWRLADYMDKVLAGAVLVNDQADRFASRPDSMSVGLWQYNVSLQPSFGLNYHNLGGNEINPVYNMPGMISRAEAAAAPSQLIVFASARVNGSAPGEVISGFWRITCPNDKTVSYQWPNVGYTYDGGPGITGNVDPRWNDRAATAHLDGSATTRGIEEMRDMTRWSNTAAQQSDPDWVP